MQLIPGALGGPLFKRVVVGELVIVKGRFIVRHRVAGTQVMLAWTDLAELQNLLARPGIEPQAQMFLGYALGKELDDLQQFDEAFPWFATAAAARRSRLQYDIGADEQNLRRIIEVYPGDRESKGAGRAPGRVDSSTVHLHSRFAALRDYVGGTDIDESSRRTIEWRNDKLFHKPDGGYARWRQRFV
jgi:hypothetical protein